jgi:hypothetical protein
MGHLACNKAPLVLCASDTVFINMPDTKLQLILFPLWWYTTGIRLLWQWVKKRFGYRLHGSGFTLFVRHLAEPLYGDYTRSGRLISLFLRLFLLLFKTLALGLYGLALFGLLCIYLAVIPFSIVMIIYQLFPF